MSKRYAQLFAKLNDKNQGAFVPFVTIGDPNPELSFEIIKTLIDAGADALELGIPYSDPVADGPTIQKANIRAIDAQVTPPQCFEVLKKVREYNADIPIGLLLYSNIVFAKGLNTFYQTCADIGIDSVLVADVPTRESKTFCLAAEKHGIAPIFIAPPNGKPEKLKQVAELGQGYTYLLSRAGVTGTETEASMPVESIINALKSYNAPPSLLGFGISKPEHVKAAITSGADGAISGSAVVKIIEENLDNPSELLAQLNQFISSMKAATQR
ncbi:tryptophan synthase subunit alpha [Catenovulum sp. 2E275]|uniref:tryptophan synthase subunit alpha n=1 Tax=Catenovulum sp. 2E275 TaxID=2980497 RepID=UPI0021D3C918|nr:tryptophan synthase subunit alpha [Catenovulum sp. 2E275]MCU4674796.1 tryptophan synthase subunit alpha [Catenovulum sp. 2E275]